MKIKLLSAALLSLLSINVYSDTLKVIEIKKVKSKMIQLGGETVKAIAIARPAAGRIASPIDVSSYHEVYLSNPTNHAIKYEYEMKLCGTYCVSNKYDKTLQAGEAFKDARNIVTQMSYLRPDDYSLKATTDIMGEYKHSTFSFGKVTITR